MDCLVQSEFRVTVPGTLHRRGASRGGNASAKTEGGASTRVRGWIASGACDQAQYRWLRTELAALRKDGFCRTLRFLRAILSGAARVLAVRAGAAGRGSYRHG